MGTVAPARRPPSHSISPPSPTRKRHTRSRVTQLGFAAGLIESDAFSHGLEENGASSFWAGRFGGPVASGVLLGISMISCGSRMTAWRAGTRRRPQVLAGDLPPVSWVAFGARSRDARRGEEEVEEEEAEAEEDGVLPGNALFRPATGGRRRAAPANLGHSLGAVAVVP